MPTALEGEITDLEAQCRYQKAVAHLADLQLVMYEGDRHIVPWHPTLDADATLLPFLERFHYSADMAALYTCALTAFRAIGGVFFNVFVPVPGPGRHGFWGARRRTLDDSPRGRAIMAFNPANAVRLSPPLWIR
ncbi:hypothetical protein [Paracoccus sp. (in: a-proteobacteria)]|uniref:hypothetical protein n=1 Tax=Paracoccus sp. TaxID=267 RepID=UPI00396CD36F